MNRTTIIAAGLYKSHSSDGDFVPAMTINLDTNSSGVNSGSFKNETPLFENVIYNFEDDIEN